MVRVLQVTSKLFRGGAETFMMNVYRNIDRTQVQFDFLVFHTPREYYEDEIESLGGHVYHVPIMEGANLLCRKRMLDAFFDKHHDYAAVHCHMAALGRDVLHSAADHGIGRLFSHSHIADFERTPRNLVKQAFQKGFGEYATKRLACSRTAGEFMYPGKDFEVVNNGIDVARFAFDAARRDAFRASYGFSEEDMLVGHVGRFELMKNHAFLIDVFTALARNIEHVHLVLAGDGSLREDIENRVRDLGLSECVHFLGLLDDMPSFYDGVDCFAMPSLFEGLPFSAVEAQCSGLSCVLSDRITNEVAITDLVEYLPLEAGAEAWADCIERTLGCASLPREDYAEVVTGAGFDIQGTVSQLAALYTGRG
ncbi:glycosyltransferase family 1 protein [uncultured Ellagibacter sp.]|uniref:glycosyltransferase family 1 protein n=1 Tax=uncultured Ellagibacter sp. TaxID=2137580 RepID=UPI002610E4BD|nr:glycosyltransferase family 1 protein [uncultured Ellagibacter sp.]